MTQEEKRKFVETMLQKGIKQARAEKEPFLNFWNTETRKAG
jgi:hypothetical protein